MVRISATVFPLSEHARQSVYGNTAYLMSMPLYEKCPWYPQKLVHERPPCVEDDAVALRVRDLDAAPADLPGTAVDREGQRQTDILIALLLPAMRI